jgi:TetR/AcrR family transcriptional regulator, fatty acid metabolism regulator protein
MYKNVIKRKEKIIITAIEILDEDGINGLTTKEIARRHNVTEPAIYKQFDSKKEIILAILDRFALFDEVIKNTILDNKMKFKEGVLYFTNAYAEYYQNYPQITTVMFSFDVFKYEETANKKMTQIINGRYDSIVRHIMKGIEKNELPEATEVNILADAIFDVIWSSTFIWKMKNCSYDLKERMIKTIEKVISIYNI